MAKQQESSFVVDQGDIEIHGEHPVNKHEKPIAMPEEGDDGQPVALQNDEQEGNEPIQIITDTEEERLKAEKAKKAVKTEDEDEVEEEGDDDVTRELKRQRNRARRQANKERQKNAERFNKSEIRRLKDELAEVKALVGNTAKISKLDADQSQVERIRDAAAAKYSAAKAKLSAAFAGGDPDAHAAAMEEMFQQQQMYEKAEVALKNIDAQKKAPEQQRPNTFVEEKRKEFLKNNPWFDDQKKDRDSRIALRISKDLINEEYAVDSDEYWEELETRIAEQLPNKKDADMGDEDEDEPAPKPKPQQQKQKLPISSGGGREAKGNGDDDVKTSDISSVQRSILRQMGYTEGSPEWLDQAKDMKKRNQASRNR